MFFTAGMTVSGIPIAMLLNALAGLLSSSGADTVEDVAKYRLITKEGYVTMGICLAVMGILLIM